MSASSLPATVPVWLSKSRLVKVGLAIIAAGLVSSLLGAVALAQGQTSFEFAAGVVHRFGQFLLFLGLCVVLVAQRTDSLYRTMRSFAAWLAGRQRRTIDAVAGIVFLLTIPALVALPPVLAGLAMFVWAALLPAALSVMVAFGDRRRRAFCLGGIFPALILLIAVSVALSAPQLWTYGPRSLYDVLAGLSRHYLPFFVACWVLVPLVGVFAMGLAHIQTKDGASND